MSFDVLEYRVVDAGGGGSVPTPAGIMSIINKQ